MPKIIPSQELDAILSRVTRTPNGVGVGEIRTGLPFELPPRTLQRRLKFLEEEKKILSKGSGKGKRYFPVEEISSPVIHEATVPYSAGRKTETIQLSNSAQEIGNIVRGPLISRTPVGYNPDFLNSYIPNKTEYLPKSTRTELARVGHVGADLPAGTYVRQVLDRLLIDLSWNSSRLEGNTYSLLETELLVKKGESAGGKNADETQMILNHKAAIEMLADQADEIGFNRYTICNLHALLSDGLLHNPTACGTIRDCAVGISGTVFHPLEVPQLIEEHFLTILNKAQTIQDPFEQAFFVMVHLPYLQPFEDVNKRVSRLAANIPMVRYNLCPLSFIDVPQDDYVNGLIGVYELNRIDYLRDVFVWAYQRSAGRYSAVAQSLGKPDPLRLRYRTDIKECVHEVVAQMIPQAAAAKWIEQQASARIDKENRSRFIEVVETELLCLHEGNIARYRLRPRQFADWDEIWK